MIKYGLCVDLFLTGCCVLKVGICDLISPTYFYECWVHICYTIEPTCLIANTVYVHLVNMLFLINKIGRVVTP